jgi:hypothetical protein
MEDRAADRSVSSAPYRRGGGTSSLDRQALSDGDTRGRVVGARGDVDGVTRRSLGDGPPDRPAGKRWAGTRVGIVTVCCNKERFAVAVVPVKPREGLVLVGVEPEPQAPRADARTATPAQTTMLLGRYIVPPFRDDDRVTAREEPGNAQTGGPDR